MPEVINPKPTKGTGILRFSEDIYLEFKYNLVPEDPDDPNALVGYFHSGETTITLSPSIK